METFNIDKTVDIFVFIKEGLVTQLVDESGKCMKERLGSARSNNVCTAIEFIASQPFGAVESVNTVCGVTVRRGASRFA